MARISEISSWKSDNTLNVDEFFIKKADVPELYQSAQDRYDAYLKNKNEENPKGKNPREVKEPVEQLSPKGLALMSYLYSQKDGSDAQPLVADSVKSFKHIITLMDNAPPGTSVTVILQPTDSNEQNNHWRMFSSAHKTVLKFEKTEEGMRAISMDSTNNYAYALAPELEIKNTLNENAKNKGKPVTQLEMYSGKVAVGEKDTTRQKSDYECGIFATKDAREMNRDENFYEKNIVKGKPKHEKENVKEYDYQIPAQFLKSSQSSTEQKEFKSKFGDTIATRKNKTLAETFDKHGVNYAEHFAKKYNRQVANFVHNEDPATVKAAAEKYDAGKMTLETLTNTYGPKPPEPKSQSKQKKGVQFNEEVEVEKIPIEAKQIEAKRNAEALRTLLPEGPDISQHPKKVGSETPVKKERKQASEAFTEHETKVKAKLDRLSDLLEKIDDPQAKKEYQQAAAELGPLWEKHVQLAFKEAGTLGARRIHLLQTDYQDVFDKVKQDEEHLEKPRPEAQAPKREQTPGLSEEEKRQALNKELSDKIASANTLDDIVKAIQDHKGNLYSSGGTIIAKEGQLRAIEQLRNSNPNDNKVKLTSNYGIEAKVIKLVEEENKAKMKPPEEKVSPPRYTPPKENTSEPKAQALTSPLRYTPPKEDASEPKPQALTSPPKNDQTTTAFLAKYNEVSLNEQYHRIRAGSGAMGWARLHAKNLGQALGNGGQIRREQISEMVRVFEYLKENPSEENSFKAWSYLNALSKDIHNEHNKMEPALAKMCAQMMAEIDTNRQFQNRTPIEIQRASEACKNAIKIETELPKPDNSDSKEKRNRLI